ncbi:MAG: hypothetical protein MUC96_12455 [Myxococcaceae bacterium]|jgi:hypothetical protein|nr:hypothetical protein [Myxococcaceae bacterium]
MLSGTCVAGAVERCAAVASALELTSGTVRLRGTTLGASHDTTLGCALAGSVGPDVVYGLKLTERRRLTATVRPLDPTSGFLPVIGLRSDCARDGAEVACGFTEVGGDRASLVADGLAPGAWFLWVDAESDVGGAFELELSLDQAPRIDSCSAPGVLRGADVIDVAGDTTELADDFSPGCGAPGAPDAVYRLTLERPRRVRLEAVGLGAFRPLLSLRRACADGASELACAAGVTTTSTAALELPALEAGDYWVIVDGTASPGTNAGRFQLRVRLTEPVPAPTNDTCATALELDPSTATGGTISLQGDTSRAKNDASGCEGTGPELVYAIDLAAPRRMVARVVPLSGSRLQPVLYLRRAMMCESAVAREQLACTAAGQAGFPALLDVPGLEAGRWYLFVDGRFGTSGAFDLQLEFTPPPAPPSNDSCTMPTPLPVGSGMATFPNETTVGATRSALTCASPSTAGDVAYTLTLASRQSVSLDAHALTGSPLLPVLSLKPQGPCALTAASPVGMRCAISDDQVPDRAVAHFPVLDPGTYTLWVSGDLQTQGAFSLRVLTGPPIPPASNDVCGSMTAMMNFSLTVGSTSTGDTRGATPGTEGRCGLPPGANGEFAPDVVYTLQVSQQGPVTITVSPEVMGGELFRPVVYVRGGPAQSACTSVGANVGCQAAPDFGQPVSLTLPSLAPGLYSVWVDGAGTSAGRFSVSIR